MADDQTKDTIDFLSKYNPSESGQAVSDDQTKDTVSFLKGQPEDKGSNILRRAVVDPAVGLARGLLVGVPEAVTGIADIPTLGYAGKAYEAVTKGLGLGGFKEQHEAFNRLTTPETMEAQRKVAEAKGFVDTTITALQNPSAIAQTVAQSIPPMLAGGRALSAVASRFGLGAASASVGARTAERLLEGAAATAEAKAPMSFMTGMFPKEAFASAGKVLGEGKIGRAAARAGMAGEAATRDGFSNMVKSALGTVEPEQAARFLREGAKEAAKIAGKQELARFATIGGIAEGLITAGQNVSQIRQEEPTGTITAKQAAIGAMSGALTGVIGVLGGRLAAKLGFADFDTLAAGAKLAQQGGKQLGTKELGIFKRLIYGAIQEGIFEELPQSMQEQLAQNIAQGKPITDNVVEQGAMGMLAGFAQSMGINVASHVYDRATTKLDPTTKKLDQDIADLSNKAFSGMMDVPMYGSDDMSSGGVGILPQRQSWWSYPSAPTTPETAEAPAAGPATPPTGVAPISTAAKGLYERAERIKNYPVGKDAEDVPESIVEPKPEKPITPVNLKDPALKADMISVLRNFGSKAAVATAQVNKVFSEIGDAQISKERLISSVLAGKYVAPSAVAEKPVEKPIEKPTPIAKEGDNEALGIKPEEALGGKATIQPKEGTDWSVMVGEGLNTEHPEVSGHLDKYVKDNDAEGISQAVKSGDYGAYQDNMRRFLKGEYPDGKIPVKRVEGYLGGAGQREYSSVSVNPEWGKASKAKGKKVTEHTIDVNDVVAIGNTEEGELIVKSSVLESPRIAASMEAAKKAVEKQNAVKETAKLQGKFAKMLEGKEVGSTFAIAEGEHKGTWKKLKNTWKNTTTNKTYGGKNLVSKLFQHSDEIKKTIAKPQATVPKARKAKAEKVAGPQNLVTYIQKRGGIKFSEDLAGKTGAMVFTRKKGWIRSGRTQVKEEGDLGKLVKIKSGIPIDELIAEINDEFPKSGGWTVDDLVDVLKSGKGREIVPVEVGYEAKAENELNKWADEQVEIMEENKDKKILNIPLPKNNREFRNLYPHGPVLPYINTKSMIIHEGKPLIFVYSPNGETPLWTSVDENGKVLKLYASDELYEMVKSEDAMRQFLENWEVPKYTMRKGLTKEEILSVLAVLPQGTIMLQKPNADQRKANISGYIGPYAKQLASMSGGNASLPYWLHLSTKKSVTAEELVEENDLVFPLKTEALIIEYGRQWLENPSGNFVPRGYEHFANVLEETEPPSWIDMEARDENAVSFNPSEFDAGELDSVQKEILDDSPSEIKELEDLGNEVIAKKEELVKEDDLIKESANDKEKAIEVAGMFLNGDKVVVAGQRGTVVGVEGSRIKVHMNNMPPKGYVSCPVSIVFHDDGTAEYLAQMDKQLEKRKKNAPEVVSETGTEINMRLNADLVRMALLTGRNMYANSIGSIVLKELLQNSFDTIKERVYKGLYDSGKVLIKVNSTARTIEFIDDGMGMDQSTVEEAFFKIFSTKKDMPPELRSGGLGVAKMAIFTSAERVRLTTVKDGVRLTVEQDAVDILRSGQADGKPMKVTKEKAPKSEHGTAVKVWIPENFEINGKQVYVDYPVFEGWSWNRSIMTKPLVGPIEVSVENEVSGETKILPLGLNSDNKIPFRYKVNFPDWGWMDIYYGEERKSGSNPPVHQILSAGIFQFNAEIPLNEREKIPYDIIIDVHSKVPSDHEYYPFNNTREDWRPNIKPDINGLTAYLQQIARGAQAKDLLENFQDVQSLPFYDWESILTATGDEFEKKMGEFRKATRKYLGTKGDIKDVKDKIDKADHKEIIVKPQGGGIDAVVDSTPTPTPVVKPKTAPSPAPTKTKEIISSADINKILKNESVKSANVKPETAAPNPDQFLKDIGASPDSPIYHSNINVDLPGNAKSGDGYSFLSQLGSVLVEMKKELSKSKLWGFDALGDMHYAGISVDKEYSGLWLSVPYKVVYLNPFKFVGRDPDTFSGAAEYWYEAMIHEFAHTNASAHGVYHDQEELVLGTYLADKGLNTYFRDALLKVAADNYQVWREMKNEYDKSTTQNLTKGLKEYEGKRLASAGSNLPRDRNIVPESQRSLFGNPMDTTAPSDSEVRGATEVRKGGRVVGKSGEKANKGTEKVGDIQEALPGLSENETFQLSDETGVYKGKLEPKKQPPKQEDLFGIKESKLPKIAKKEGTKEEAAAEVKRLGFDYVPALRVGGKVYTAYLGDMKDSKKKYHKPIWDSIPTSVLLAAGEDIQTGYVDKNGEFHERIPEADKADIKIKKAQNSASLQQSLRDAISNQYKITKLVAEYKEIVGSGKQTSQFGAIQGKKFVKSKAAEVSFEQLSKVYEDTMGEPFPYRFLAPLLEKTKTKLFFNPYNETKSTAWFAPSLNEIHIGRFWDTNANMLDEVYANIFAHEAIHAIIDNIKLIHWAEYQRFNREMSKLIMTMDDNLSRMEPSPLKDHLNNVFNYAFEPTSKGEGYDEFVTYALTDPIVARWMDSIKLPNGKAGQAETLWSKFKNIIRETLKNLFGIEKTDGYTMLDKINDILDTSLMSNVYEIPTEMLQKRANEELDRVRAYVENPEDVGVPEINVFNARNIKTRPTDFLGLMKTLKVLAEDTKQNVKDTADIYKKPTPTTDLRTEIDDYLGENQIIEWRMTSLAKQINKELPKPRQHAIARWMRANGDTDLLKEWAKKYPADPSYKAALTLTEKEKEWAEFFKKSLVEDANNAVKAGLTRSFALNYLKGEQLFSDAVRQKMQAIVESPLMNADPEKALKMIMKELERSPKNIGASFIASRRALLNAMTLKALITKLTKVKEADGRNSLVIGRAGSPVNSEDQERLLKVDEKYLAEANYHKQGRSTRDYKTFDHPSMFGHIFYEIDEEGKQKFYRGDIVVHPAAQKRINALLGKSLIREWAVPKSIPFIGGLKLGNIALKVGAFAKGTMLGMSPFHLVHTGSHSVFHGVNPFNLKEIDFDKRPLLVAGVKHGLLLVDRHAMNVFSEGLAAGGLWNVLPTKAGRWVGETHEQFTKFTFENMIPRMKADVFEKTVASMEKAYAKKLASGQMTRDQLLYEAAATANNAFGGQNYKSMGRNPTLIDAMRLFLLAPDFLESRLKFAFQALTPEGRESRVALFKSALYMSIIAQIGNMLIGDDKRMHWDKPFSIIAGGREWTPRSVAGDMIHLITDWRNFSYNRLNPVFGKPGAEIATGRDRLGRKIEPEDIVKDTLKGLVPIPFQGTIRDPGVNVLASVRNTVMQSVGLSNYPYKTPFDREVQEAFQKRIVISSPPEDRKRLTEIRKFGDEIKRLREEGKPIDKVMMAMHQAVLDKKIYREDVQTAYKRAKQNTTAVEMKSLQAEDLAKIWKHTNEQEKITYRDIKRTKLSNLRERHPERYKKLKAEYPELWA